MMQRVSSGMPALSWRHWQAWSVWLAIALFPLFAAGASSGASTPFAWLVLVGLLFGWRAWPTLGVSERRIFIGFAVFFAAVLLSFLLGEKGSKGASRLNYYAAFVLALPAYLAIRRYVSEPGRPLLLGLALSPLGAVLFGIELDFSRLLPALLLQERFEGAYRAIILSNITVLLTLLLLAGVIVFARGARELASGGVLVFIGLLVVIGAGSRNSLLFLPFGVAIVLVLLHRYLNWRHGVLVALLAVTLAGWMALAPKNVVSARVDQAVTHLANPESKSDFSVSSRFEMWRHSVEMWREAPIFGAGLGSFHYEAERRSGSTKAFEHAHSIYFDALATTGLVGVTAMLVCVFVLPLWVGWQAWRRATTPWQAFYAVGMVLTVLGFMFFGLTEAWFSRSPMFRTYLLCLMVLMAGVAAQAARTADVPDTAAA